MGFLTDTSGRKGIIAGIKNYGPKLRFVNFFFNKIVRFVTQKYKFCPNSYLLIFLTCMKIIAS